MQRGEGSGATPGSAPPSSSTTQATVMSQLGVAGRLPASVANGHTPTAIGVLAAAQQAGVSTAAFTLTSQVAASARQAAPQAIVTSSQAVTRLLSPSSSLPPNAVQLPTFNVLQRQLSAPGVVGISAQDLQQVLQQNSQQPVTLLTPDATATTVSTDQRPSLARTVSYPLSPASSQAISTSSSVSATGGTIHHHGQNPVRGSVPIVAATLSHSNLQHSLLTMNLNQQQTLAQAQRCTASTAATTTAASCISTAAIGLSSATVVAAHASRSLSDAHSTGTSQCISVRPVSAPPPRKKLRLEEKPAATPEIANHRKLLIDMKLKEMREIKCSYFENLTEMFFLQNGGNLMDYHVWKKRPTPQLVSFLKSGNLDSDDDEDVLQVKEINSEVKVLTNPGSNVPLATPVAISTTLPPKVSALSQQVNAPTAQAATAGGSGASTATVSALPQAITSSPASSGPVATSQLQLQLSRTYDSKAGTVMKGQLSPSKQQKSPPPSPGQHSASSRQQSLSLVYDQISGSSQEVIVERAKQEAQVMQRVAELRKEGLWSSRRLPRVQEPPRQKAHWDYLLEEMTWLAADFVQERKWKKAAARKLARMVANYFKDQEQKELRAEKEEAVKLKKIASHIAKMVREFWTNIEKVVQYKQQTRLEEKKKKALDLHLSFIVDQTEKYSSWLTQGLQGGSTNGSVMSSPLRSSDAEDFEPQTNTSDDEETIEKEENECALNEEEAQQELEDLQIESQLPLEELIKTLPEEVLAAPAPIPSSASEDEEDEQSGDDGSGDSEEPEMQEEKEKDNGSDEEFAGDEADAEDNEDTIAEQEKHEKHDYSTELDDLQAEGEMSIEDLAEKYAGAYDSDFEIPEDSSSDEDGDEDDLGSDSDDIEIETESSSEGEQVEELEESYQEEPGLEALVKPSGGCVQNAAEVKVCDHDKDETRDEITDIAAQALSLQPKGYTLETTEVKTKVPPLLKHSLREYQHVGLDWLATMHDKRLNGILADEMGLGKTIQTIALLAHLACEKGIWGPHLIVVPTSVMLNWEMELKKWCPAFKILTYYGTLKERKLKRQGWTKTNAFHVCITSYKLVVQDHQAFRRKKWKYLILDEAQNIKNFKSQRWQMLLNFQSQRRLLLTGTPLQNSLMELWSLMHFLMPNVFQSHRDFKEWFSNPLTGMIEGSQEYNESLIKRLHKVLRPFLLRRLKNEVEKQMPKKYEHVIMCPLSKRQRFLYDDFMSQTKTKETLASGHYMSVINILMQLRKVCNHPNLFDPRPIVSPFQMEGIVLHTASLVARALEYDPFKHIDLRVLFPCLAEMERDLPAFVSHRVRQLCTPGNLIEEIDSRPNPPPRPPCGQLKPTVFRCVSPAPVQTSDRGSPVLPVPHLQSSSEELGKTSLLNQSDGTQGLKCDPGQTTVASPVSAPGGSAAVTAAVPPACVLPTSSLPVSQVRTSGCQTLLLTSQPRGSGAAIILSSVGQTPTTLTAVTSTAASAAVSCSLPPALQAKVVPQQSHGTSSSAASPTVLTSQPITVQIQQTEQGTRLMIPTGQLSQLPAGLIQLVQTSSGQQLIAAATSTSSASLQASSLIPLQNTTVTSMASSTVNGPTVTTTVAATSSLVLMTTATGQIKTTPAQTSCTPSPVMSSPSPLTKPVMRVSPMVAASSSVVTSTTSAVTGSLVSSSVNSVAGFTSQLLSKSHVPSSTLAPVKRSPMYLEFVHERRRQRRAEKLRRLARINAQHCSVMPVYGQDVQQALALTTDLGRQHHAPGHWLHQGYASCHCAAAAHKCHLPQYYWHETTYLAHMIQTPDQYLDELKEMLDRFVFVIPSVISPGPLLRVSHPNPSKLLYDEQLEHRVKEDLHPVLSRLNSIQMHMAIQFPELRLIQYDCGKLQTLDVLLRQLKRESHRVLIFTQMTKMLDVLEAFLNHHGHRYLRLDGTTRVEQRQALMDRFNADRRIFCFILSTRSGGIGVNLTGADTVIFYDSDWNPTMDAQAQDRCHRIGQTRDVHIYRLISEMTVEENILKKANQKRLLGDLAIEGGNFTTAFFKEQTIKDLFAQPSGLQSLADKKQVLEELEQAVEKEKIAETEEEREQDQETGSKKVVNKQDPNLLNMFEQALCKAEDETDAMAATLVRAEQKAELAEFDESIPWDEREAERRREEEEVSRAELELASLEKELTPIERYAVALMEAQMEDEVAEELKMAEEDIENSKKDWELARLKALKEEEERRAELEDDEMLYTYLRDDAQVFVSSLDGSAMPIWAPPTPPQDDNDIYMDQTLLFLHEPTVMVESQLPPVYARKDHKKPRVEAITTRKQKQRKDEAPRVPRSLFDRPTAALLKMRRELKMQKLKAGLMKQPFRPTTQLPPCKPVTEQSEGHPEWLIHEDWALLQAVQTLLNLPLNLTVVSPAHIPNWDLVADVVNSCSRVYRSVKQCKARYENVIIPREEGRILYDVSPRKQKKTKGIYKTKNNRPMKTSQLYSQDGNSSISLLYSLRFDSVKSMASRRPATMRQTLNNPSLKNPKHAAVLQENGINYDQPLNAMQVAAIRAERIAREKKQAAAAAAEQVAAQRTQQQQQQQQQQQGLTAVATTAPAVAQAVTGQQLHSLVSAPSIIQTAATPKVAMSQGLTAVSIARTLATTGNIVAVTGSIPGVRGQRAVAVHEITTVGGNVAAAQVTAQAQARATTLQQPIPSPSGNLTAQLAPTQKLAAMAGTSALVHQQLVAKGFTPQQINLLHPIMRSQNPAVAATQAQQIRAQKLSFTTQKQGLLRMPAKGTEEAHKPRLQQKHLQGGQQILQGQVQAVGQPGSSTPVAVVKSVSAPAGTSTVPIPVSINVSMGQGQQKTGLSPRSGSVTVNQLQHRMQLLHQRKAVPIQQHQKVTAITGQARAQIPLLIPPQAGKLTTTEQILHQIVKQQQQQQQIIAHTSQPTIITAATQGQTLAPVVAKVSLTTVPHTSHIQTLSAAAGTPITVTQVAPATSSSSGANPTVHHASTVATINMAGVVPVSQAAVVKTAALSSLDGSQQSAPVPKIASIPQSLVTQSLQLTSTQLTQQQHQTVLAPGPQHRVISANATAAIPPSATVVVSSVTLSQAQQTTPGVMQQQQLTPQLMTTPMVAAQAISSPSPVATVVTQTSAQQQLSAQQQMQKPSPYAMRSRNPPKH